MPDHTSLGHCIAAMCQIPVVYGEAEKNLQTAASAIAKAHELGAQIAVLPECFDLGWANPLAETLAEPIPGKRSEYLGALAKQYDMYIVAGLTERDGDKLYNTAVLIDNNGALLIKHRKIGLLFDVEGQYSVGDRLNVAHTPLGCIGIDICADNTMGSIHLAHSLCRMGADMILSPCAWAVPEEDLEKPYGATWLKPYRLICQTYGIAMVGVSCVGDVGAGAWEGWYNIGNSIAMGPSGKPLAILPFGKDAECIQIIRI